MFGGKGHQLPHAVRTGNEIRNQYEEYAFHSTSKLLLSRFRSQIAGDVTWFARDKALWTEAAKDGRGLHLVTTQEPSAERERIHRFATGKVLYATAKKRPPSGKRDKLLGFIVVIIWRDLLE